jgi:hypothetical protein
MNGSEMVPDVGNAKKKIAGMLCEMKTEKS